MCHIFCDTASAKKPPTPKNEKGKKKKQKKQKHESLEITFSLAQPQCHSLIRFGSNLVSF